MQSPLHIVAGGAGFIGSHLCEFLIRRGERVLAVDDLSTGSLENLSNLMSSPHFMFYHHDITLPIDVNGEVKAVYNLACPASPKHYAKNPIKTFLTSIEGSKNLLDLADKKNATILLASTSEIYGDPIVSPQRENYFGNVNTVGERSCYDEGKRGAETLFNDYHRCHGTDTRIIRIFNTYGPRMASADGRVVPAFITSALKGQPFTVFGSGRQTRSFMYVSDLIEGIIRMMSRDTSHLPVNLGNPTEISINKLVEIISELTAANCEIIFLPLPEDDPKMRKPDISRATELLSGWKPKVNLYDGLTLTIDYFKQQLITH